MAVNFFQSATFLGIPRLKLHQLLLRFLELRRAVGFRRRIAHLVKALELLDGIGGERGGIDPALVGIDEFAELCAPIAEVVVPDHRGSGKGQRAAEGFADYRLAKVEDLHLLCGVGRAVIDHARLALAGGGPAGREASPAWNRRGARSAGSPGFRVKLMKPGPAMQIVVRSGHVRRQVRHQLGRRCRAGLALARLAKARAPLA